MSFNSYEYALFLALVVAGFWVLPNRARMPLLLVSSYFFYATLDWRFLGLLVLSTAVDFTVALALHQRRHRRDRQLLLAVSVVANLSILGYFKYADFFVSSVADLLARTGADIPEPALAVALPVGISFYTFQSMSYTIDVYRGRVIPTRDPVQFATYVAFFPQLLAGPIERAGHLLPQLSHTRRRLDPIEVREGIELILLGLFKKVAVADPLSRIVVQDAFTDMTTLGGLFVQGDQESWLTLLAGCFGLMLQVYCDFSGYSDIARGSARLLGIDLSRNFLRPFSSTTYRELWQRWHVTLFDWFRDYVYIPLGGNRRGRGRGYLNIVVVFTLSGLWHGARGGFVLWGFATGLALIIETEVLARLRPDPDSRGGSPWGRALARAYVWALFALLMMPIVVPEVDRALDIWWSIFTFQDGPLDTGQLLTLALAALAVWGCDRMQRRIDETEDGRKAAGATSVLWPGATLRATLGWHLRDGLLVVGIVAFAGAAQEPFFYFQF